ncbi:spore coat protein [Paenibacillus dendritiformis]|uniref:spore coat protein n=1 Tax=Paenibacillus dendritiformis TaxID=130049 RepID=UPI00140DB25F|nr:spore coat protein [Paenibacillus dendritiformis]
MHVETRSLGAHETLELHELLTFKNACMTKTATMYNLVSCQELKGLMQQDIQHSAQAIKDYQGLLSRAHS